MLLQTIEPTHERQSAKALKNVESTIAPSRTIEGAGELVDAISASNKEKAFALKGYLHYLRRELAEATDFFRRAPKRTTFVATMSPRA
ncbi:MAG: hypothetical protein KIT65_15880 [Xanthobacteraceae bacterium]|nr:hypothetical protein [Xanthobacteraceae bacterium]